MYMPTLASLLETACSGAMVVRHCRSLTDTARFRQCRTCFNYLRCFAASTSPGSYLKSAAVLASARNDLAPLVREDLGHAATLTTLFCQDSRAQSVHILPVVGHKRIEVGLSLATFSAAAAEAPAASGSLNQLEVVPL